jgi:DNA-binding winged helix-turn-helix (wHTH) protein/TolB-like protein/Tfp pilus assembly protein PilF
METLSALHFRFENFELDRAKRLLLRDGEPVSLNPKAFELLLALVESRGKVLTKDELLERVWPDQIIEEGNLKVHISALRKALGQIGSEHRFIVTIPGRGYSFVADLQTNSRDEIIVEARMHPAFVEENEEPLSYSLPISKQVPPDRSLFSLTSPKTALLTGLSILVLVGAGLGYWFLGPGPVASTSIGSIAVMPFVNEGGNAEVDYLSDGMTESLINSLSRLPGLSVKARSIMFRYKAKDVSPTDIGSDLHVQAVLLGRVVERGEQLTLYLSLVDARTGDQIWGDQYTRKMIDLVALQNEIARDVSRKLRSRLSGAEERNLAKNSTEDAEAYRLYLKGRYYWNKFTPADHLKAIDHFNQAIARDPGYALAYAGLADTYGASATNSWIPSREGYLKAKAAVRKALEIDESLAQAHANLGAMYMFSDFNWNAAEQEYKLAIELDPNYEVTHEVYSYLLSGLGRHDEAIAEAQRARELDPLSASLSDDLALAYNLAGRYDDAIKQNLKTLEIEPDRPDTIWRLGTIYEQKGMYEEAITAYQKAINFSERTSNFLGCLGHAYAASGRTTEAHKILNEMMEMSKQTYVSPYDLAILYTGLGEKEKAIEQLDRAYEQQSGWIINLQVDPFLNPLRDHPRFEKLIDRLGL